MAYRGNKTGSFEEIPSQLMSGCPDGYTKNANGDCVKITSKPVEGGTEFTETTETTTPGGKETKPKGLPGFKSKWDNMTASEQEEFDDYFDFEVKARQYNIDKYGDPSVDKTSKTWIEENAKKNSLKKAEEELNIDLEKKTGIKPTYEATHITNKELKERVKKIPNKDNTDTQRELNIAPVSRMRTFGRSKYGTPKTSQFLTGIFGMKTIRDKSVEDKYSTDVESRETDIEEGTKKRRGLTWKPLQKP